jgi:hypothetical protein
MKLRKSLRILLWSTAGLVVAVVALYLLRWPLLEGTIRRKVSALMTEQLHATAEIKTLRGSLLRSITATDVTLVPGPAAPFRSARADRVSVTYGLLGSGEPSLTVEGVHVVLTSRDGPAPPLHETIRDVVSVLRSLRFSGSVEARKVDVVLPDGRVLALRDGRLNHGSWKLSLQTEGFGTIDGSATLLDDGSFRFEGNATDGPLRSARIELGAGADQVPLTLSTELLGHPLAWKGTASFEKERLTRAEGELSVKEGRARTIADFKSGRVEADVDAVIALDEEFKGDLAVTGRGEGPISGPVEGWRLREGGVRIRGGTFRSRRVDEADLTLGPGSLAEISFLGKARSGEDTVEAEGVFRWKGKPDIDATVRASVADIAPWLALIPEPPAVKALKVRVDGKFGLHDKAVSFDGSVASGPGSVEKQVSWKELALQGSFRPGHAELREGAVTGSNFAPSIAVTGKLDEETVLIRLKAGADTVDVGGRLEKNGDFEGRIRIEGPLDWLGAREAVKPLALTDFHVDGKVRREKDDIRVLLDVSMDKAFQFSPSATIRRIEGEWGIALAPGTVTLQRGRIDYSEVLLRVAPGKISFQNLKLLSTEPEAAVRLSGSVTSEEKETQVVFVAADTRYGKTPIDTLVARVTIDKSSGDVIPLLRWGKEDGDHLHVSGRVGKEKMDLKVEALARELNNRPLLRLFLPTMDLEGAVSVDVHVTGTTSKPEVAGTLSLSRLSTAGLPPLSLVIPVRTEGGAVRFWASEPDTPYGKIEIDGTVPLSGEAPLDVTMTISTRDFKPLLDQVAAQTRPWIPQGDLRALVSIHGVPGKIHLSGRAEFAAAKFRPPHPLPEATDLRVWAQLDDEGVEIETADGILGRAPFWASGRWDLFLPGRPLALWVTAREALVIDDPLARLRVTPDAILSWKEGSSLKLTGRLEVPLVIYHREFNAATPGGRNAPRQIATPRLRLIPSESGGFLIPGIEGLEALELGLKVTSTGEIRIENSVIGILVSVDGHLGGTAAEPALSGTIRSRERRGEVKLAPGNFMRIESAEAFLPEEAGRSPTVRFHGRVGTGEGAIQVLVNGPLESPNLVLQSDPPLPQKDLLARLAFGVGPGKISGETGAATLALYLYDQAQDNWPDADRKETFFSRIRPQVIPAETTERRVPWELPPSGTLKSTSLRTEYVYNKYFSIIGETNREGDVGGDLKLRIRF